MTDFDTVILGVDPGTQRAGWCVGGECVSNMASGKPWVPWVNVAAACPSEWPFGTVVYVLAIDRAFICLDRGGAIEMVDGVAWIDTLTRPPLLTHGTVTEAEVRLP